MGNLWGMPLMPHLYAVPLTFLVGMAAGWGLSGWLERHGAGEDDGLEV